MTHERLKEIQVIFNELAWIDNDLHSDLDITSYLQINETDSSIIVIGNKEGFIHLATCLLELALAGTDGKHYHFGVGALENCSKELEVLYKNFK